MIDYYINSKLKIFLKNPVDNTEVKIYGGEDLSFFDEEIKSKKAIKKEILQTVNVKNMEFFPIDNFEIIKQKIFLLTYSLQSW